MGPDVKLNRSQTRLNGKDFGNRQNMTKSNNTCLWTPISNQ